METVERNMDRGKNFSIPEAMGQSEAFIDFQEQLSRVAPIDRPVLIMGERGTGKELAASRVHFLSRRWQKPLITLNCAALTPGLIGSELFGYEKGAFTGAAARRIGRFEMASEGTLFLDEIGTIPPEVQEKILRVVEYGCFERVGASAPVHVDVRIVGATNADLRAMARAGRFKQDLLDRLCFEVIYAPPLRCRKGDISLLAEYFAARMAYELGRDQMPVISDGVLEAMEAYPWPGNVRELKNVIERAVYKSNTPKIREITFDPFVSPFGGAMPAESRDKAFSHRADRPDADNEEKSMAALLEKPFKEAVADLERFLIERALKESRYNRAAAARKLDLSYDQFRGLWKRHYSRI